MYSPANPRQISSVFITCCQPWIHNILISEIRCQLFHIFGVEVVSMLLFKLWFTLKTCNSDLDKFQEILSFSIVPSTLLLAGKTAIWFPGFVLHLLSHTAPHSTTALEIYAVNIEKSMLLQRKDFSLLPDLDPCDDYKIKLMKLKEWKNTYKGFYLLCLTYTFPMFQWTDFT